MPTKQALYNEMMSANCGFSDTFSSVSGTIRLAVSTPDNAPTTALIIIVLTALYFTKFVELHARNRIMFCNRINDVKRAHLLERDRVILKKMIL